MLPVALVALATAFAGAARRRARRDRASASDLPCWIAIVAATGAVPAACMRSAHHRTGASDATGGQGLPSAFAASIRAAIGSADADSLAEADADSEADSDGELLAPPPQAAKTIAAVAARVAMRKSDRSVPKCVSLCWRPDERRPAPLTGTIGAHPLPDRWSVRSTGPSDTGRHRRVKMAPVNAG